MELFRVYSGQQSWEECLGDRALLAFFDKALTAPGPTQIRLGEEAYYTARDAGLGALGSGADWEANGSPYTVEIDFEKLAGGVARLNADFHLMMGDALWKIEMRQEAVGNALRGIRLPEFEREARAYRSRAETAYLNGWYEEALSDFLEAEKRNYPDFAVHRSLASVYLYRLLDLPRALDYFSKAAKYAQPNDAHQAAEAHYFAGVVCALLRRPQEAIGHLQEAATLHSEFYEAHYQRACLLVLLGKGSEAVASLEAAITGDPRYYERARRDRAFAEISPQVQAMFDRLMKPVQEKLAEIRHDAEILKRYVIARPEKRQRITSIFRSIEEQTAATSTYGAGLRFMEMLIQAQKELKSIYDLFFKQYEIDGRDYVRSIAFSPDGRLVAAGFLYEGIKIWEVDSAQKVRSLRGHTASVNSVAFSPNNEWLVSGSRDRTIRLWDVEGGRELRMLVGHDSEVRAVTFSPDGEWIASASHDRTVRLWRAVTGREAQTFDGHTHHVTSVAFSPDGGLIASGSTDRMIKLWDTAGGREARTLEGHARGVESLAFSADGQWLASGGDDKTVRIWDVASGENVQTLRGHRNDITSVAFSPDGQLVAAGSLGQTIRIWRVASGEIVKTLWYPEISWNAVAFSPKGQWLASGSHELQLWLKNILTQEQYEQVRAGEEHRLVMQYEPEMSALERAEREWMAEEAYLEAV
ncbi:MAG TPA: hypothetical protein VNO70_27450, partial [Blastocatellia bacterium]|nr:hypothetical protein [Blastocatellia bacterium]